MQVRLHQVAEMSPERMQTGSKFILCRVCLKHSVKDKEQDVTGKGQHTGHWQAHQGSIVLAFVLYIVLLSKTLKMVVLAQQITRKGSLHVWGGHVEEGHVVWTKPSE